MLVICEYAIAYFAKTRISHIFRIKWHFQNNICEKYAAYVKKSHICRIFPHMRSHFSAFSLSNVVLRPPNILVAIRRWINWSRKCQICAEKAWFDHNYDSPSLKFAFAGNMQKNMLHISGICSIYAAYFAKFHIFSRIFCLKKFCIF